VLSPFEDSTQRWERLFLGFFGLGGRLGRFVFVMMVFVLSGLSLGQRDVTGVAFEESLRIFLPANGTEHDVLLP
jgi:hypothetical protein